MEDPRRDHESEDQYFARIVKSWRSKFPKSSVFDDDLIRRIKDLLIAKENNEELSFEPMAKRPKMMINATKKEPMDNTDFDQEHVRKPNSKGQMNWNQIAIQDLINCHAAAQAEHKVLVINANAKCKLSELLHAKFTALHPYCKLSPALLMSKCYNYKSAIEKGDVIMEIANPGDKTSTPVEQVMQPAKVKRSASRDLVYRTWSQDMIDDMLKTRKIALDRKKIEDLRNKDFNMTDFWYEEFLKLQPDYKSSKKNLFRKYKWYKARLADVQENQGIVENFREMAKVKNEDIHIKAENTLVFDQQVLEVPPQPLLRMKNIRKDVFHYLKAVLEESRIFLPMKLPDLQPATPDLKGMWYY